MDLLTNTGIFLYPLALCSFIAVFITVERLIALRNSSVIPQRLVDAFVEGDLDEVEADLESVTGRIICFHQ